MHRLMRLSLLVALALTLPLSLACASPVIQDVYVERGLDIDAPDWVTYHQQVTVTVADADGAADITSVTITDPSAAEQDVTSGYPDGNYRPAWQISRDQMAVYIARAFDLPI